MNVNYCLATLMDYNIMNEWTELQQTSRSTAIKSRWTTHALPYRFHSSNRNTFNFTSKIKILPRLFAVQCTFKATINLLLLLINRDEICIKLEENLSHWIYLPPLVWSFKAKYQQSCSHKKDEKRCNQYKNKLRFPVCAFRRLSET